MSGWADLGEWNEEAWAKELAGLELLIVGFLEGVLDGLKKSDS